MKLSGHLADLLSSKENWYDILAMIQGVGLTSWIRFPQEPLLVEMCNWSIRYRYFFLVNVAGIKELMSTLFLAHGTAYETKM